MWNLKNKITNKQNRKIYKYREQTSGGEKGGVLGDGVKNGEDIKKYY